MIFPLIFFDLQSFVSEESLSVNPYVLHFKVHR